MVKNRKLYLYFSFIYKYEKINGSLPMNLYYVFFFFFSQLVAQDVEERHPGFD